MNRICVLTLGFIALAFSGCATARMPLPDTLAASERLEVEGRQGMKVRERLRFGPYEATAIERSWTRGSGLRVQIYEGNKRVQQYRFKLSNAAEDDLDVSCGAFLRTREADFDILTVEFENRSELDCTIASADDPSEVWTLSLRSEGEDPLAGDAVNRTHSFRVEGTRKLQKAFSPGSTTGYELLEEGRAVAAVEVINGGAVWVHNDVPSEDRGLLAATAASLLLYEDLRAHVEEP